MHTLLQLCFAFHSRTKWAFDFLCVLDQTLLELGLSSNVGVFPKDLRVLAGVGELVGGWLLLPSLVSSTLSLQDWS